MTYKQRLQKLAEENKVEITISGGRHPEVLLDAPEGFHFSGNSLHQLVTSGVGEQNLKDVWPIAYDRLKCELPLEACTKEECEEFYAE